MDGARRPRADLPAPTDPPLAVEAHVGPASALSDPPDGLSEAEQACWRKLAPLAIRQRTLTDAEVPGFRDLCQVFVMKEQVAARIAKAKAGAATKAVDGLLRHYAKLGQQVDARFARFKLTAFGKPSDAAKEKPAKANPWANMAAK